MDLQQKQVAKIIGITNVSLCKVQKGERKLKKQKLKILADVLQVEYKTILDCAGEDVDVEIKCAKDRLNKANENMILLLDGLLDDSEDIEILQEVVAILNKSDKKEKNKLKEMLKLLKTGIYHIC